MTATYRAAVCTALTGPSSIEITEQQVAPLKSGEIRIEVHAAGLNFPDLLMTEGKYQFRPDTPRRFPSAKAPAGKPPRRPPGMAWSSAVICNRRRASSFSAQAAV